MALDPKNYTDADVFQLLNGVDPSNKDEILRRLTSAGINDYVGRLRANHYILSQQPQTIAALKQAVQTGRNVDIQIGDTKLTARPDGSFSDSTGSIVKPLLYAGAFAVGAGGLA